MRHFAEILVVFGIISISFRERLIKPYTLQPFEFSILLAALIIFILLIHQGKKIKGVNPFLFWVGIFVVMTFLGVLGSINAYRIYGFNNQILKDIIVDLFYIIASAFSFLLVYILAENIDFRKYIFISFLIPLLYGPFIFIPSVADKLGLLGNGIYFKGFMSNPSDFSMLSLFCLASLFMFFTKTNGLIKKLILWSFILLMISIIIWTGSRAAWFSVGTFIILYGILHAKKGVVLTARIKQFFLFVFCAAITIILSFAMLPHRAKIMSLDRIFPRITNYNPTPARFDSIRLSSAINRISKIEIPYQSRQFLWPEAIALSLQHPFLGLGFEYSAVSKQILQNNRPIPAHNTILQSFLVGGAGLLIIYLLIAWKCIKAIKELRVDVNDEWIFLVASSTVLTVFSLSGDYLFSLPWIWIPISLLLTKRDRVNILIRD